MNDNSIKINELYERHTNGENVYPELQEIMYKFIKLKTHRIKDNYLKEEIEQVMNLAIYESLILYDSENKKKSSFRTFLQNMIHWRVSSYFKKWNHDQKKYISIDVLETCEDNYDFMDQL